MIFRHPHIFLSFRFSHLMNLGNAIKLARKLKGYKQKELADLCSISPGFLSQIESNQRDLNVSTLEGICKRLEIPIPILFFMAVEDNDIPPQKKDTFRLISPVFKNLISDIWMTDETRSA